MDSSSILNAWQNQPGEIVGVSQSHEPGPNRWGQVMRQVVDHPDDPYNLRGLIRGNWTASGTLPIQCWMEGHKNRDEHASGFVVTEQAAGYRCSACKVNLTVLELGVERGFAPTTAGVAVRLLEIGIDLPSHSRNGSQHRSPVGEQSNSLDERTPHSEAEGLVLIDATELLNKPFQKPEYVVDQIIPRGMLCILTGDSGSGKTALALHIAIAIATRQLVAERFEIAQDSRPVLYINGEMGADTLAAYLHALRPAFSADIPEGRLWFEGTDGLSTQEFAHGMEARAALEEYVNQRKPSLVVFDTTMALFEVDENVKAVVRPVMRWLKTLTNSGASVLIVHHLRKISKLSNSPKERVSGSRDWINAADVHLAAISREGTPMYGLLIAKVRVPGAKVGACWPIQALEEMGEFPTYRFLAGDAERSAVRRPTVEECEADILQLLGDGEAKTRDELNVGSGNRKRAFYELLDRNEITKAGRQGRTHLFGLSRVSDLLEQ